MRSSYDPTDVTRGMEATVFIAGCIGASIGSWLGANRFVEFYDRWIRWP